MKTDNKCNNFNQIFTFLGGFGDNLHLPIWSILGGMKRGKEGAKGREKNSFAPRKEWKISGALCSRKVSQLILSIEKNTRLLTPRPDRLSCPFGFDSHVDISGWNLYIILEPLHWSAVMHSLLCHTGRSCGQRQPTMQTSGHAGIKFVQLSTQLPHSVHWRPSSHSKIHTTRNSTTNTLQTRRAPSLFMTALRNRAGPVVSSIFNQSINQSINQFIYRSHQLKHHKTHNNKKKQLTRPEWHAQGTKPLMYSHNIHT